MLAVVEKIHQKKSMELVTLSSRQRVFKEALRTIERKEQRAKMRKTTSSSVVSRRGRPVDGPASAQVVAVDTWGLMAAQSIIKHCAKGHLSGSARASVGERRVGCSDVVSVSE